LNKLDKSLNSSDYKKLKMNFVNIAYYDKNDWGHLLSVVTDRHKCIIVGMIGLKILLKPKLNSIEWI
jgi:hypothetical protein